MQNFHNVASIIGKGNRAMDHIQDAADALRALANDGSKVTKKTARLRKLLPDIERALEAGISHEQILEVLNQNGLDLKMGAYSAILWRIRHEKQKSTPGAAQAPPVPPASPAPPAAPVSAATVTERSIGEGSNPPQPVAEIQQETSSDLVESRKNREAKGRQYIGGTSVNPILKQRQGNKK